MVCRPLLSGAKIPRVPENGASPLLSKRPFSRLLDPSFLSSHVFAPSVVFFTFNSSSPLLPSLQLRHVCTQISLLQKPHQLPTSGFCSIFWSLNLVKINPLLVLSAFQPSLHPKFPSPFIQNCALKKKNNHFLIVS